MKLRARNLQNLEPGAWKTFQPIEEPSMPWFKMHHVGSDTDGWSSYENYENDRYYCTVRRFKKGFFIKKCAYIIIGISNIDETARHDWRDFQQIKNDLAGKDWEGIELYPAESRHIDPSNRFYMWCVPKGVLDFGLPSKKRKVLTSDEAVAPQRPFPNE